VWEGITRYRMSASIQAELLDIVWPLNVGKDEKGMVLKLTNGALESWEVFKGFLWSAHPLR